MSDSTPGCTYTRPDGSICGLDNDNSTHDALEHTGHLSHSYQPAPSVGETARAAGEGLMEQLRKLSVHTQLGGANSGPYPSLHLNAGPFRDPLTAPEQIPLLFGTWLSETKRLQESFFMHHYGHENFRELQQAGEQAMAAYLKEQAFSMFSEVNEFTGEFSWKPWASASFVNRDLAVQELIDVLHFVANALCALGVDMRELNLKYSEKMRVNEERQKAGYTGLDKCSECHRSFDDVAKARGLRVDEVKVTKFNLEKPQTIICLNCAVGES